MKACAGCRRNLTPDVMILIDPRSGSAFHRDCFVKAVMNELDIAERMIQERERILQLVPPCSQHGDLCFINIESWILQQRKFTEVKGLHVDTRPHVLANAARAIVVLMGLSGALIGVAWWVTVVFRFFFGSATAFLFGG